MPDNPFLTDEDENDGQAGQESTSFKQVRDYAKRLERQSAAQEKELEKLRTTVATIETERRTSQIASVFKESGLSEKHAALYARVNPEGDVTVESVTAFATEYELPRTQSGEPATTTQSPDLSQEQIIELGTGQTQEPPKATSAGFAPTEGTGAASGTIITDHTVAIKLLSDNPAEYARLHQAGRIKLDKLPGASA